jgi:hypothetical protein
MATVDMRHVNFWLPPDYRPNTQRTAPHKHHGGSALTTANSRNPGVPLYNEAGSRLKHSGKSKSPIVAPQDQEFPTYSRGDRAKARGT